MKPKWYIFFFVIFTIITVCLLVAAVDIYLSITPTTNPQFLDAKVRSLGILIIGATIFFLMSLLCGSANLEKPNKHNQRIDEGDKIINNIFQQ